MAGRTFESDLRSGRIPFSKSKTTATATATAASDDDDNKVVYSIKIKSYSHGLHAINGAIKEMKKNNKTVKSGEYKSGSKSLANDFTGVPQPTFVWIDLNNDKVVSNDVKNDNSDNNDMDNYSVHNYNYSSDNSSNDDDGGDGDINADKHRNGNRNRNSKKCDTSQDFNHQDGFSELYDSPSPSPSSTSYPSTSFFPSSSSPPPSYPLGVFNACDRALENLYVQCDPGTIILVLTQADIQPLVQLLSEKQRSEYQLSYCYLTPTFFSSPLSAVYFRSFNL